MMQNFLNDLMQKPPNQAAFAFVPFFFGLSPLLTLLYCHALLMLSRFARDWHLNKGGMCGSVHQPAKETGHPMPTHPIRSSCRWRCTLRYAPDGAAGWRRWYFGQARALHADRRPLR